MVTPIRKNRGPRRRTEAYHPVRLPFLFLFFLVLGGRRPLFPITVSPGSMWRSVAKLWQIDLGDAAKLGMTFRSADYLNNGPTQTRRWSGLGANHSTCSKPFAVYQACPWLACLTSPRRDVIGGPRPRWANMSFPSSRYRGDTVRDGLSGP
jgi:hypothetical protein